MTGRDLILYILQNNLEDEPIFKDGKFIGFLTAKEAAAKWNVGEATIRVWFDCGVIKGVKLGSNIYIFVDNTSPLERKE